MFDENITFKDHDGRSEGAKITGHPDKCPMCTLGIEPRFLSAYLVTDDDPKRIAVVFQCPRSSCRTVFAGHYEYHYSSRSYLLDRTVRLVLVESISWPEVVTSISGSFCRIYAQAHIAESNGLDQVCGPGYRRALEFLVKDYLIHCGDDESAVKTLWLGKCIERIKDENIKATARRAAWLGNDETHYERTWEKHDLKNLKDLIRLTVNWIESAELTKQYVDDMPEP